MKEEHTSGLGEFVRVIAIAALLYIICAAVMSLFDSYAFIGGIISILVFCVFGYFVLVHYTARFTYSIKGKRLRINRMIGKRNREVEFDCKAITRTYFGGRPQGYAKPHMSMRVSVINAKKSLYIEYRDKSDALKTVIIEPTERLKLRIEKERIRIDD